jgi:MFS family permease
MQPRKRILLLPAGGGVLLDHYSWRSLFWFLTIFMALAIPLLVFFVPESKLRVRQKLDLPGALLLGAGLAMVLLYVSMGEKWGWDKPSAFGWAVAGVVLIALWYAWEKKADSPLIDIKLLTAPKVAAVLAIALLANMIIGGQNLLTAYIAQTPEADDLKNQVVSGAAAAQGVPPEQIPAVLPSMQGLFTWNDSMSYALGFSLLAMALHLAIWQSLTSMVAGPLTGALGKKAGLRLPMMIGMGVLSLSMIMYVYLHGSWQALLICGIVYGVGFGMYYAAAPNLMIEAVPQEQQGVASGMLVVAQSFGSSIAVALMSPLMTANRFQFTVLNPQTGAKTTMDAGNEVQGYSYTSDLFVQGFWLLAACGLVGLVVAVVMKHGRTRATGGLGHLDTVPTTGTARESVGA